MAVIFGLSSRRSLPTGGIDAVSILGHFAVYAVLASLLTWGLRREGLPMRRALSLALALATLYGITDEIHQSFVPGRDPDPLDLLIDALGAGAALALIALRHARDQEARN
jgi:VanZ family protein